MSKKRTVCIHIYKVDKDILMNEGVELFLETYPQLTGTHISIKQMFSSLMRSYFGYRYPELINKRDKH